jgi:uncharacterized protein YjcR
MNEQENGQLLAERTVRSRASAERWEQIKTAYASGIGLREIARNMNIPEGTVLARAKREGWSKQSSDAKSLAKREETVCHADGGRSGYAERTKRQNQVAPFTLRG